MAGAALRALGRLAGRLARWRLRGRCITGRRIWLLALLAERLTSAWAGRARRVRGAAAGGVARS
ncbi:MAG: hypothetical protein U0232_23840 [Thermomicrobiales bacterium]